MTLKKIADANHPCHGEIGVFAVSRIEADAVIGIYSGEVSLTLVLALVLFLTRTLQKVKRLKRTKEVTANKFLDDSKYSMDVELYKGKW